MGLLGISFWLMFMFFFIPAINTWTNICPLIIRTLYFQKKKYDR